MKKIISLVLSVIMLMSLLATCISAANYDIYELEDYGQMHYYLVPAATAPVSDGVINEGEYGQYGLAEEGMKTILDDYDTRFFRNGACTNLEYFDIYMNYDAQNIYFAARVRDKVTSPWADCLWLVLKIGNDLVQIYMPEDDYTQPPEVTINGSAKGTGHESIVAYEKTTAAGEPTVYELTLKRSAFANVDKILVAAHADDAAGHRLIYGFENLDTLEAAKVPMLENGIYGHTVHFINSLSNLPAGKTAGTPIQDIPDESEIEKPEEKPLDYGPLFNLQSYGQTHYDVEYGAAIVDGTISKGEYSLAEEGMKPSNDSADRRFFANGTSKEIKNIDVYVAQDDEYLYLAARSEDTSHQAWSDSVMFLIGTVIDGKYTQLNIYKPYDVVGTDGRFQQQPTECWIDGSKVDSDEYVAEHFMNVSGDVITYEVAVKRSALGEGVDRHLFAAYLTSANQGSVCFAFNSPAITVEAPPMATSIYGNVINLKASDIDLDALAASVPDDGWMLTEYGQLHLYAGSTAGSAPKIDGKVSDGEYNLAIEDMLVANDENDDRFFLVDRCTDVEGFDLYFSQDERYVYIAAKVKDAKISTHDALRLQIGTTADTNVYNDIAFRYNDGDTYVINTFVEDARSSYTDGTITYEIALKRTALADFTGMENLDKIYFRATISMGDANGFQGELWFGFSVLGSSPLLYKHEAKFARFPHVLFLYGEDEEAPVYQPYEYVKGEEIVKPNTDNKPDNNPDNKQDDKPNDDTGIDTNKPTAGESDNKQSEPAEKDSGCGVSLSAIGVVMLAILGGCAVLVGKKKN